MTATPNTAALQAAKSAYEDAATHIEQRDGSIPYRQEIAAEIRAIGSGYKTATLAGFTPEIRTRCQDRCSFYGDPACYRMPDLVDDLDLPVTPCEDCINDKPYD